MHTQRLKQKEKYWTSANTSAMLIKKKTSAMLMPTSIVFVSAKNKYKLPEI